MNETLYASRPLINGDEFVEWAKSVGFEGITAADDLHVTFAYSRTKFDWSGISPRRDGIIVMNGKRELERFDGGATVLRFESPVLTARWQMLKDAGASWDYDDFKAHITISYNSKLDLKTVKPYTGRLVFGYEKFKPIDEDWKPKEA